MRSVSSEAAVLEAMMMLLWRYKQTMADLLECFPFLDRCNECITDNS